MIAVGCGSGGDRAARRNTEYGGIELQEPTNELVGGPLETDRGAGGRVRAVRRGRPVACTMDSSDTTAKSPAPLSARRAHTQRRPFLTGPTLRTRRVLARRGRGDGAVETHKRGLHEGVTVPVLRA